MEDSKLAKFANGGNMGLSSDQLEIYKVIPQLCVFIFHPLFFSSKSKPIRCRRQAVLHLLSPGAHPPIKQVRTDQALAVPPLRVQHSPDLPQVSFRPVHPDCKTHSLMD